MKANLRLLLLLVLMVVVPLVAVGAVGARLVRDQAAVVEHEVAGLLTERLRGIAAPIDAMMAARERSFAEAAAAAPQEPDAIRGWLRKQREFGHVLIVDRKGKVLFPPPKGPSSADEKAFLERTRTVWRGRVLPSLAAGGEDRERGAVAHGWHGWYEEGGLNLLFWLADGERIVALELPRIELLAAVVAALPAGGSDDADSGIEQRTALLDAGGSTVYQWGDYEPEPGEAPRATVALALPLGAWHLAHFGPVTGLESLSARGLGIALVIGLAVLTLALVGMALFLYRESTRGLRLAAQRVSFVNQVSHELKTPLTNIRLYAELLEEALPVELEEDEDDKARGYLDVIVSESQRLSRLIGNVLTFARGQQDKLRLRPAPCEVDRVVAGVCENFGPPLAAAGVRVEHEEGAAGPVMADADAIEQILANLLGNIEKYAAAGGLARVTTARRGEEVTISVSDRGPGVPVGLRERIFEPFVRVSDRLSDGVTGTGIGLDIARRLARLHGGDLVLRPSEEGASFLLTLHAPPASGRGEE